MHMRDQRIIPFPPALIEALKSARRIVPDGVQALAIALEYETEENLLMMAIRTDTLYGDLIRHFISTGHIKSGRDIYSFIIQTLKTYKNSPDLNDEMYNSFTTSELLEDKFKGINWLDLQILKKYGYYKKTMPRMW